MLTVGLNPSWKGRDREAVATIGAAGARAGSFVGAVAGLPMRETLVRDESPDCLEAEQAAP